IFLFLVTFNNVYTKTYEIERYNRAKETIRSPITIEDEQETERKTRETSQAVQDRYDISTEITEERIKYVEEIFEALSKMEDEVQEDNESTTDQDDNEEDDKDRKTTIPIQEKLNLLKEILSQQITDSINDSVLMTLIEIADDEREEDKQDLVKSLTSTL